MKFQIAFKQELIGEINMIIYDKASWHIDAGMNEQEVLQRLQKVFNFLNENDMLSDEGKEQYEIGIDDSCSLNERTVTSKGNEFLKEYYNDVINNDADSIFEALTEKLKMYSSY